MEFTAEMIAGFLGGDIVGNPDAKVWTISKIEEGVEGSLTFLSNPKYEQYLYTTGATIAIVNREFEPKSPVSSTLIKVDDAYGALARLLELYAASKPRKTGISGLSAISETAMIGKDCYIGEYAVIGENAVVGNKCRIYPQVYIGDNVRIGDNVTLYPGVKVYEECVLGNNITIHSGAIIGGDGFGFAPNADGKFEKIPQIGNVVIEDDVEIGANTCIDRATMGSTILRRGVKLDNLIQIAHNVVVGENTVMASQVGIAGSTKIGSNCMFGGQVGIIGHIEIGDRVQIASQSGISHSLPDDGKFFGVPAQPAMRYYRILGAFNKLPELSKDVENLKKQVANLKSE